MRFAGIDMQQHLCLASPAALLSHSAILMILTRHWLLTCDLHDAKLRNLSPLYTESQVLCTCDLSAATCGNACHVSLGEGCVV